jgi:two-component system, OmpR family, alkaline phosphatase synthesis response regulator PhoP
MVTKSILVIEDDADIQAVVKSCLIHLGGWSVVQAVSGHAGIDQAQTHAPDAILLDMMMPDMDGLAVLQALQSMPSTQDIPVILLTAKVQFSQPQAYESLKLAGVITKPFDPLQLVQQIITILHW